MPVRAALLVLAISALAACRFGAGERASNIDCVSIDHCSGGQVCFFGKCVDPGYSISEIDVDLFPPASSGLLPQVDLGSPRDLRDGLQFDLALRRSVVLSGAVRTDSGTSRDGTLLAELVADALSLPSQRIKQQTSVQQGSFSLAVLPGEHHLTLEPSGAALPPYGWSDFSTDGVSGTLDLIYPADGSLVPVYVTVVANLEQLSVKEGARVSGVANVGATSGIRSTSTLTDANGRALLVFPPGAQSFAITVEPADNPYIPTATRTLSMATPPSGDAPGELETFVLNIGAATESLTTVVRSPDGDPLADASVLFQGQQVGAGSFAAQAMSALNGSVERTLLPGLYALVVSPSASQPYALTTRSLCVLPESDPAQACGRADQPATDITVIDADEPLSVTVGTKVTVTGRVTSSGGFPVAGARLSMSLRGAVVRREFVTTTAADGTYALAVDPAANAAVVEYEVAIEPEPLPELPLPRHREIMEVTSAVAQARDIRLYDASLVYGHVYGPGGAIVKGARVDFYSSELGTEDEPLLVASGESDEAGEFVVAVPVAPD